MGGFFSGSDDDGTVVTGNGQVGTSQSNNSVDENTPGGLFSDGGNSGDQNINASKSASDAKEYAEDAKGWAVGDSDGSLSDWSDTNNSKYYSEESKDSADDAAASATNAAASASSASSSASAADADADRAETAKDEAVTAEANAEAAATKADSDAKAANSSASSAATSAQEAETAKTAAETAETAAEAAQAAAETARDGAEQAEVDAQAAQAAAEAAEAGAKADSEAAATSATNAATSATNAATSATNAATSATSADSEADRSKSWAVGPSGDGVSGTDTDNAEYWAGVAKSHADASADVVDDGKGTSVRDSDSDGTNHRHIDINNGFGLTFTSDSETLIVDTEKIADTDWVKNHVTPHSIDNAKAGDGITITSSGDTDTFAVNIDSDSDGLKFTSSRLQVKTGQTTYADSTGVRVRIYNPDAGHIGGLEENSQGLRVDTDVIADTEWVKEHVSTNSNTLSFENERDDTTFNDNTLLIDSDTGLEIVQVGGKAVLRTFVAAQDFAISISGGQSNRSWFNSDTTDTATVSASIGTLQTLNSGEVNNVSTNVTVSGTTVTYPVSATAGSYTLEVDATGSNSDGSITGQDATASHSWTVYRDYWLTSGHSNNKTFSSSDGRVNSNFTARDYTINTTGYAYLAISKDQFPSGVTVTQNGNPLSPLSQSDISVVINGVSKTYIYYNLGNFTLTGTTIRISA